jgi:hypothetical protein
VIRTEPDRASALARRAAVHAALGDRDSAAADFAAASARIGDVRGAVLFAGQDDRVTAPHVPFDNFGAFTVEAWVFGWSRSLLGQGKGGEGDASLWVSVWPWGGQGDGLTAGWADEAGELYLSGSRERFREGWNHLAVVFDGDRQILFVNGKRVRAEDAPPPGRLDRSRDLRIGALADPPDSNHGTGFLGALRVSTTARYADDFAPNRDLASDGETFLLLDFSEGDGERVPDRSGHGRDATVRGVSRVRPPG